MELIDATHVVFDVDGTLYDKRREYLPGRGSIEGAHEFFRYATFSAALEQGHISDEDELVERVVTEYQRRNRNWSLLCAIGKFPERLRHNYHQLVRKHGSNGKVFVNEFGADSGFFARIVGQTDFRSILAVDKKLQAMVGDLKIRGYKLGILTTEIYSTVEIVFDILGLSIDDFRMDTGTDYPLLCSENVADSKPSPEGFLRLIEINGVDSARKIVYVGDDFKKDVEASLKVGLQAVHVTYDGTEYISFEECTVEGKRKKYVKIDKVCDLVTVLR